MAKAKKTKTPEIDETSLRILRDGLHPVVLGLTRSVEDLKRDLAVYSARVEVLEESNCKSPSKKKSAKSKTVKEG